MSRKDLPYRPCVGTMVLNRAGRVFIGRRTEGPEHVDMVHAWQMPQGGIDPGEDPWPAALRELYEETSIRSVERLGEIGEWLNYDLPADLVGQAWKGKYRGQKQKWYALRFTGDDREIDVATPGGGAVLTLTRLAPLHPAPAQGNKEGLWAISASMTSALRRSKPTEWKTSWISSIASNASAR